MKEGPRLSGPRRASMGRATYCVVSMLAPLSAAEAYDWTCRGAWTHVAPGQFVLAPVALSGRGGPRG